VDEYLRLVAARTWPNIVSAQAFDLKVFFTVVGKEPAEVTTADVLEQPDTRTAPTLSPTGV
jgi:integrase/recombinase XerD